MRLRSWVAAAWTTSAMLATACGGSSSNVGPQADSGQDGPVDAAGDLGPDVQRPDGSARDSSVLDSEADGGADSSVVDTGATDVVEEPDAAFVEATHTLPIITNNGGPTIANPLLVTITYSDDTNRAVEESIGSFLVQSSWISTAGAEYGVGKGTSTNVELTQASPATIDDSAIQSFLASLITAGTAPDPLETDGGLDAGATWSNAVYMIYFPSSTMVTVAGQGLCQYSAGGYHYQSSVMANGHVFAYAVVSPCPGGVPVAPPNDIVWTASHELMEACTDPYVLSAPGYVLYDQVHPWSYVGGEVGDLCTYVLPQWAEGPYTAIQRIYSNASAMAGGAPCIPSPEPYYGADGEPSTFVSVAAGSQKTFQVTGWSTAPVPAWSLATFVYSFSGSSIMPTTTLGTNTLLNGQTTTLTVGMPAGTPSGTYAGVFLQSYQSTTDYTTSLVGVYVP